MSKRKTKAGKSDILLDGTLDKLIAEDLIDGRMATSLAYDSEVVAGIIKKLIEVTELLYISSDTLIGFEEEIENGKASVLQD